MLHRLRGYASLFVGIKVRRLNPTSSTTQNGPETRLRRFRIEPRKIADNSERGPRFPSADQAHAMKKNAWKILAIGLARLGSKMKIVGHVNSCEHHTSTPALNVN